MKLFEHQRIGAEWLAARAKGYLGDPPGEGKTLTLLTALKLVDSKKALVVCPAIVRTHWRNQAVEAEINGKLTIESFNGITAGGMQRMREYVQEEEIDTIIIDEGHYAKNVTSQRTRILLGKDGYARRVPRVWLSSGNPIPKHPGEYWTVMASVFPEIAIEHGCTTREQWMNRFTNRIWVRDPRGVMREKVLNVKNVPELQEILDATMIRRVATDAPTVWWQQITLDSDQPDDDTDWSAIDTIRLALEEGTLEAIANDPYVARIRRNIGLLKVAPVASLLRQQLDGTDEKVAVFAYHTDVIDGLAEGLKQFGPVVIDGRTSEKNRAIALDRFATSKATRVFIGQNTAAGTGMDGLQYATRRVILVEPSWSNYENVQIAARAARRGQAHRVIAQFVSLAGTIDEAVVAQNVREAEMKTRIEAR